MYHADAKASEMSYGQTEYEYITLGQNGYNIRQDYNDPGSFYNLTAEFMVTSLPTNQYCSINMPPQDRIDISIPAYRSKFTVFGPGQVRGNQIDAIVIYLTCLDDGPGNTGIPTVLIRNVSLTQHGRNVLNGYTRAS